ncbi:MAG: non-ribosomal peptide synthetase, partial [Candidatus Aminicenantes bacterium]
MSKEREIEKIYSLTPMQEGMLFHFIKDKGSTAYFDQYLLTLRGEIDKALLEKSLNTIIKRHEVLRTLFVYEKIQKPKQVVLKDVGLEIDFVDISHLSEAKEKKYLEEFKRQDREKGFDLTRDIPMRVFLFKPGRGFYRLLWSFHHITMDGWSFSIFLKELIQTYQGLRKGESFPLEPVSRSFRDYVRWLEKQDRVEGLKYWQEYLEGYEQPAGLHKPGKAMSDENHQYKEEKHGFKIHEELTTGLTRTAASHQVTINSVFQVLWGLLLQKYNNTNDVVFGTVVSGRPPQIQGIENMIGLFINTIPVRIKTGLHQRFSQIVVSAQKDAAASRSYEYLPLADIQASSLLKGHLIDHILVLENYPVQEEIKKPGKRDLGFGIEGVDIRSQTSYDFNIIISPGKHFSIRLMYNGLVYDKDLIERTALHFEQIVRQVKENPAIEIKDIEIITAEEKRQILTDFNQPDAGNPPGKSIHELFAEQAEEKPDNTALVGGNGAPFGQVLNAFGG